MMRFGLALAAVGLAVSAVAAEKIQSGLQPGARTSPFQVVDVTGPNKGKQLCYV
jgi:hypothetical protein